MTPRLLPIAALLLLVPACPALDVSQPITLLPSGGWSPGEQETLRQAAGCWNLAFGTQLSVGDEQVAQQVEVAFSDFICTYAAARTEPNLPVRVSICQRWFAYGSHSTESYLFFHVLLHELGHVLNIRSHAGDPQSVMASGEAFFYGAGGMMLSGFSAEDRQLLAEANPGFEIAGCDATYFDYLTSYTYGCLCPY